MEIVLTVLVAVTFFYSGWNASRMISDKRIAKWFSRMGEGHHTVDADGEVYSLEIYKGYLSGSRKKPAEDANGQGKD